MIDKNHHKNMGAKSVGDDHPLGAGVLYPKDHPNPALRGVHVHEESGNVQLAEVPTHREVTLHERDESDPTRHRPGKKIGTAQVKHGKAPHFHVPQAIHVEGKVYEKYTDDMYMLADGQ